MDLSRTSVLGGAALLCVLAGARPAAAEFPRFVDSYPFARAMRAAAVSPDGAHVYLGQLGLQAVPPGSGTPSQLYVAARDPVLGGLTPLTSLLGPGGDVSVNDLAVGPGGDHVYWVGARSLHLLARDPQTGIPSHVTSYVDGEAGIDGLAGAVRMAVSTDGRHVYVTGRLDDAVTVFAENDQTGVLDLVQVVRDSSLPQTSIDGAAAIAISPDGAFVYVGASVGDTLAIFTRDPSTGTLALQDTLVDDVDTDGISQILALALTPDGRHLVAGSEHEDTLTVFARDAGTGALTYLSEIPAFNNHIGAPLRLVFSPDGSRLFGVGADQDALATFELTPAGQLVFLDARQDGVSGVTDLEGPTDLAVSPDGLHLYATTGPAMAVVAFRRPRLLFEISASVPGLTQPRRIHRSRDGRHVYVTGLGGIWIFEPQDGDLVEVGSLTADADGIPVLESPLQMAESSDGSLLYVTTGSGSADGVVALDRDPVDGSLAFVDFLLADPAANPVAVAVAGDRIYVAETEDAALGVYESDPVTGHFVEVETLRAVENMVPTGILGLDDVLAIGITPDGEHLYTGTPAGLGVFDRDPLDGTLTYQNLQTDGIAFGLNGVQRFAMSPDGVHVYTTALPNGINTPGHLVAFERNPLTGSLLFQSGTTLPASDPLETPVGLGITPDGAYVAASGLSGDGLALYARDEATGALTELEVHVDGTDGIDGMGTPVDLLVGRRAVYAAGFADDAVAIFAPEPAYAAPGALLALSLFAAARARSKRAR